MKQDPAQEFILSGVEGFKFWIAVCGADFGLRGTNK